MKIILSICFTTLSFFVAAQDSMDGIYEGVQPKYWTLENGKKVRWKNTEKANHYWYSLIYIKIKSDSIFLDDYPVSIYKKDTIHSASDGGFFYYKGLCKKSDSILALNLKELFCDYCGIPKEKNAKGKWVTSIRYRNYSCKIVSDGLMINGWLFKKRTDDFNLRSEGPVPKFWTGEK
jgi:hypothetical protein